MNLKRTEAADKVSRNMEAQFSPSLLQYCVVAHCSPFPTLCKGPGLLFFLPHSIWANLKLKEISVCPTMSLQFPSWKVAHLEEVPGRHLIHQFSDKGQPLGCVLHFQGVNPTPQASVLDMPCAPFLITFNSLSLSQPEGMYPNFILRSLPMSKCLSLNRPPSAATALGA